LIASPILNAFQPFGGFPDDIREAGYVRRHDTPGIGFERKSELYQLPGPLGSA